MRRLAILLLMLALSACGPVVPEDATGEEIYEISCARCHADDLGGTSLAPGVGVGSAFADKDDDYATATLTRGRGNMPSFENALRPDQIESVIDFMRSRQ